MVSGESTTRQFRRDMIHYNILPHGISDNNARVQDNKIKLQFTYNKQTAILFCCLGRGFVSIAHFRQEFDTHQAYFLLGVIIAQLLDCLVERV